MKKLLLYFISVAILMANENYPEVFSQLGTPLYKADIAFAKLPTHQQYSLDVNNYHQSQAKALELYNKGDKPAYFKALRSLSKEHDKIIFSIKQELSNAIKNREYNYFISLSNAGLDVLYKQESFKVRNYEYYLQNRTHGESQYLEKRIKSEQGYEKRYGVDISSQNYTSSPSTSHHERPSKVILLSRPGCGYCVKAKDFMKEKSIRFKEYNIQTSSTGKNLFHKHRGTGVPLIIIGDEVIRGYSAEAILSAL